MMTGLLPVCLLLALTALPAAPSPAVAGAAGPGQASVLASSRTYLPFAGAAVPYWQWGGQMTHFRQGHTSTLLGDGRVLVAGGGTETAELYNPDANTWTATAPMSAVRTYHTATLLPTGQVLVVGGQTSVHGTSLATAELYDPRTGLWSPTGPMSVERSGHTATLLPTGQVLVAGGWTNQSTGWGQSATTVAAELYDPLTGAWSLTGSMSNPRGMHTATLLPSGKVLMTGGLFSAYPKGPLPVRAEAELYNPATGAWEAAQSMHDARYNHSATLLADGRVLVVGGIPWSGGALAAAEIYAPAAGGWSRAAPPAAGHAGHTAVLLPSGAVLVAGGSHDYSQASGAAALYDPAGNAWRDAATMAVPRSGHTGTLLQNGKVLIAGGQAAASTVDGQPTAELYDPLGSWWGRWKPAGSLQAPRSNHTATLLQTGEVLVVGGRKPAGGAEAGAELYNPATNTWRAAGSLQRPRWDHTATLLASGKVLIVGGQEQQNYGAAVDRAELYDSVTGNWSFGGVLHGKRAGHTATLLADGRVLVTGGWYDDWPHLYARASAELYDPATNTWTVTGGMSVSRVFHSATLLPSGDVLIAGGGPRPYNFGYLAVQGAAPERSAELYHPATGTWSAAAPMHEWRNEHSALLLNSGRVLVLGRTGLDADPPLASAELYDPATDTWARAGSLRMPRIWHAAALLRDGSVLVTGGFDPAGSPADAERYAEPGNTWTGAGSMSGVRYGHTATLLPSGQVLVVGGIGNPASAELYGAAVQR